MMMNNWRNKVGTTKRKKNNQELDHNEFLQRIRRSLYYTKLPIPYASLPVTEFTADFFTEVKKGYTLQRLDIEETSRISSNTYMVSPCSLVLALLYIERLKNCNPEYLRQMIPSELFLVSLLVASKFLYDNGEEDNVYNQEWAEFAHLTVPELNKLEKGFLAAINWTVFVSQEDFFKRMEQLEKDVAYREVQKRGWCTYTELTSLMNSAQLITIAYILINTCSICLVSYVAGLASIFGSALITSYLPGTSLNPMQAANTQINLTSTRTVLPDTVVEAQCSEINNDLPIPDCNLLLRNEMVTHYSVTEIDYGIDSWKWWLNSTMTWLPEYSALQDDKVIQFTKLCTAYIKFSLDLMRLDVIQRLEDFMSENCSYDINWKEVLSSNLQTQNSRQYINYLPKVTLSYQC